MEINNRINKKIRLALSRRDSCFWSRDTWSREARKHSEQCHLFWRLQYLVKSLCLARLGYVYYDFMFGYVRFRSYYLVNILC